MSSVDGAPTIGRHQELDRVRAVLARAAGGTPAALVLTGAPAVGKTRLARDALRLAGAAGFAAYAGRAHELARDVAYAPLVEAFGTTLRDAPPSRLGALAGDLPQLGLLFSGIALPPPPPLGDPALERTRLMDGLARLVERLAHERPLALLLDDAHVADESTLAWVDYLAAVVTDRPLLLVLTARPDEPGQGRLGHLVAGLAGSPWSVERLAVAPLPPHDAAELLRELLGHQLDASLADPIIERCAGRPLFLQAVARTLVETGRLVERDGVLHLSGGEIPLPEGIRAQLQLRLAPVPADERTVLHLLAVAGGELEHAVLAGAAGQPEERLLDTLDRLHRRGLLADTPALAGHELAHGLLGDALLEELSPVARARLHAALAEALAALDPGDPRIAEHVLGAGPLVEPAEAMGHLVNGCEHAQRLGAVRDAERYVSAAVAIARGRGLAGPLGGLLTTLGRLLVLRGDRAGAEAAWDEAAALHAAAGDVVALAAVRRELAMLAWAGGDLDTARGYFAAAETSLAGLAPCGEHAELTYARMITASRVGDVASVTAAAARLRELAGQLGSEEFVARAYLAEAVLDYAATDYVGVLDKSRLGLEAAHAAGVPELVMRGYDQLSVAAASMGDLAELRRNSEASLEVARQLGSVAREGWPRVRLALCDLLAGEWDRALRGTSDVLTLARFAEPRGVVSLSAAHAWVLVHRGRLSDAGRYLEEARATATPMLEADRNVFSIVAVAEAALALAEGDAARAVQQGRRLSDLGGGWMPLITAGVLGEALARAGDLAGACELAARFRAVRSCTTKLPTALADWLDGLADAAQGAPARAAGRFAAAAAAFDGLGLVFHAARARLAAAESDPAAATAVDEARAALEVFDRLGAPIEAKHARDLLRSLGAVPSRGRPRGRTQGPFSARELEVARLVATGLSNADVATQLFISPRTVTSHLDHIYGRLGLSSRTALTRYLADSGLLDDGPEADTP